MAEAEKDDLADLIGSLRAGSVVAAAGCGKTEQIVKATGRNAGRRLILTHTHAGVDALRKRMNGCAVPTKRFSIDTVAGWCLRYAASYPFRSGIKLSEPKGEQDWMAIYSAAHRLLVSGAVARVIRASYCGVFVDEYQDCGRAQHRVIAALAEILPTCVFGDPMQAIFDFAGQTPVDWDTEVFPRFPLVATLTKPHRWHNHNNVDMANWLENVRPSLETGLPIDFGEAPLCVTWEWLPDQDGPRQSKIVGSCLAAMALDGNLLVIGDPTNLGGRAMIARGLAKQGFSNIEPVDCKSVYTAARKMKSGSNEKRFEATLDFLKQCMSGIERADFIKAVASRALGGKLGTAKFGNELIGLGLALRDGGGDEACLALVEAFQRLPTTNTYRQQMYSAMKSALKMTSVGDSPDLLAAIWEVQNRIRHAGRRISYRSVGSTLLVKGLEFSNVIVVHSPNMNRKDWYVAITRATHTLKILSPLKRFTPVA